LLVATAAWLVAAQTTPARADDTATPRPLGREHPVFDAAREPDRPLAPAPTPSGEITLADAIAAALQGSPELATVSYDVRSREALALQAAARPNPELGVELEDFAGSGDRQGFDSAQTTLSLAQLVELGGKRSARVQLAERETALAGWDFETRRLAVLTDATKAFVAVLALQDRQSLVRDLESLAAETLRSVASTVRAGAVSPVEEDRARVNLERVQLEVVRSAKELERARALLAATWGQSQAGFERARGDLAALPPLPTPERLLAAAPESPELARWNAEISQREAAIALERARRIPDVTLSLGARHYAEGSDTGLVAGVSVPLPLFDRNRGNILDTRYRLARAQAERRLADVSVRTALTASYQELSIANGEIEALRDRIIPRAERVFQETRRGYATGLFRYVEVLDAQRTLFDARRELLEALAAFHFSATDLERLTGTPLSDLSGRSTP
jgi:cobalt-zinc-cadmium efflux system outer membrane protein